MTFPPTVFFFCVSQKKRITPLTESKHERNVHDESKQRSRGLSEKVDFFLPARPLHGLNLRALSSVLFAVLRFLLILTE